MRKCVDNAQANREGHVVQALGAVRPWVYAAVLCLRLYSMSAMQGKVPTYQGDPSADDMRQDPSQALTAAPPPAKPALPDLENSFWDEDGHDASRRLSISAAAPVPDAHGNRGESFPAMQDMPQVLYMTEPSGKFTT